MLKILQLFFIMVLFTSTGSFADEQSMVTIENIYDRSELWPFNVSIIGEKDNKQLKNRFPGVLIRIEEDGTALVDYGRNGKRRVQIEDTDLVENANKVLDGSLLKDFPNFVRQTSDVFITKRELVQNMDSVKPLEMLEYNKVLLVYSDEKILTEKCWFIYKPLLNDFKCIIPLIVPTKVKFYKELEEHSEWNDFHMLLPHLLPAKIELFEHDPILEPGGLTCVLLDLEGKVYEKWFSDTPETHAKTLKKVVKALKKDYENCLPAE